MKPLLTCGLKNIAKPCRKSELDTLRAGQWEAKQKAVLVAEESVRNLDIRKHDLEQRVTDVMTSIQDLMTEHERVKKERDAVAPLIATHQTALITHRAELDKVNTDLSATSQQIGVERRLLDQVRDRKNQITTHRKTLATYESLVKAYQMTKSLITENSIPRYQQACNDILDFLGVSIRIRIETMEDVIDARTKEVKTNRVFKIMVMDGSGEERDYVTWSGGEKHRIALALRHALSMMLLNRSGAKIGLMLIDEGDTKLDVEGKEALLKLIEATNQGKFGYPAKVLFITHSEDLKDRLPTKITVTSNSVGSHVQIQ
jgi:DNA repair exonuclease SbcCD ATPase subunit